MNKFTILKYFLITLLVNNCIIHVMNGSKTKSLGENEYLNQLNLDDKNIALSEKFQSDNQKSDDLKRQTITSIKKELETSEQKKILLYLI